MGKSYYIVCRIERGAFTTERTFEIELSERIRYGKAVEGRLVGTAHLSHLRDAQKQALTEDDPAYGETIKGYVQCRAIRDLPDESVVVEVPSADVIHVSREELVDQV